MSNITFIPFPEFGHFNPTLKLAKKLKSRGHRVRYVGLADFKDHIDSQGLEFVPILESRYPKNYIGEQSSKMKVSRFQLIIDEKRGENDQTAFQAFHGIEQEFRGLLQDTDTDLLIADYLLSGMVEVAASDYGVGIALFSVGICPPKTTLPMLVLCPREFDFPHSVTRPGRYYVGPSIDLERKEVPSFPWHEVDQTKPLIYSSLGSLSHLFEQTPSIFRSIIGAIKERPEWQLVLAVGPYMDREVFKPIPENVLLVNWAPQLELIEKAALMITHGGLGAVKECIFFGVPMVVFPCRWDQHSNASRIIYHGLGVRGDINNVSTTKVASLIDAVIKDPSFRSRVKSMSQVFREIEDSGIEVRVIEQILGDLNRRPKRVET